ncbi:MAG: CRISPR-associated endonuclease Cas2 [Polyangiales bacterium]
MWFVICFDIADDRRRYKAVRVLEGSRAVRVQESVFEAPSLEPAAFLRLRSRLERELDAAEDSVRYYALCGACAGRMEHHGVGVGILQGPTGFKVL